MGAKYVPNIRGRFVDRKMTNVIGANSIHGSILSGKVWAIAWAEPIKYSLDTNVWGKGDIFLSKQNLIGMLYRPVASRQQPASSTSGSSLSISRPDSAP